MSRIIIFLVMVLAAMLVSGCTGTAFPTLAPAPVPNTTYTVLDWSREDDPVYVTSAPPVVKGHIGNYSLTGKITINGSAPEGGIPQLSGHYAINDPVGMIEIYSVSQKYTSSSGGGGAAHVPLHGLVDTRGNYWISGLNPGEMMFMSLKLYNASGGDDSIIYININKGRGTVRLNLTKDVSYCDIDLTDLEYFGHSSDPYYMYSCSCNTSNTDL